MAVAINEINFPDPAFRSYIQSEVMGNSSASMLTDAKISSTKSIDIPSLNIANLKGIEYFTALRSLYCSDNNLTSLDVSNNTELIQLECEDTPITTINASGCRKLETVLIYNNNPLLTDIDLSNTGVINADELSPTLKNINMSGCLSLEYIVGDFPDLVTLDVSDCVKLTEIQATAPKLANLYLNGCVSLFMLWIPNTSITNIDLNGLEALDEINCVNSHLTSLDTTSCSSLTICTCSGQTRGISSYNITYDSSNGDKPYAIDLSPFVDDILKISQVTAYALDDTIISSDFSNGVVYMAAEPNAIQYEYSVVLPCYGETETMDVTLYILPVPIITTLTLPNAILQTAYSAVLRVTGTAPITFDITAGQLPPGLTLDTNTGVISGTPIQE